MNKAVRSVAMPAGDETITFETSADLAAVITGDRMAREKFIRTFDMDVQRVISARIRIGADPRKREDMVQDLWLHIFDKDCAVLRLFNGTASFLHYFRRCLQAHSFDLLRAQIREDHHRAPDNGRRDDNDRSLHEAVLDEQSLAKYAQEKGQEASFGCIKESFATLSSADKLILILKYDGVEETVIMKAARCTSRKALQNKISKLRSDMRKKISRCLKRDSHS